MGYTGVLKSWIYFLFQFPLFFFVVETCHNQCNLILQIKAPSSCVSLLSCVSMLLVEWQHMTYLALSNRKGI